MARFYTALATDGSAAKPEIVKRRPEARRASSSSRRRRWRAPHGARRRGAPVARPRSAAIKGVMLAGKTGTRAERAGSAADDHAWFVGFAPADDPKIVVAVMLEFGGHGARAAHIARRSSRTTCKVATDDAAEHGRLIDEPSDHRRLPLVGVALAALAVRRRDRLLGWSDRRADRRRRTRSDLQIVLARSRHRRARSRVSRASVRLIEWLTLPAYCFTLLLLALTLRSARAPARREHQGLARRSAATASASRRSSRSSRWC